MQQLVLDLVPAPAPSLAGFVPGRNVELLAVLQAVARGQATERFYYLWGEAGSGRSHLLQAMARGRGLYVDAALRPRIDADLSEVSLLAVDNVECLDDEGAVCLFNVYNRMRDGDGLLIASGPCAPTQLNLRPDLVTRLAWGLVFRVHPLTDEEKIAALQSHALARGFKLGEDVGRYLFTHWRRDMASLFTALEALDRYSLETKRPITVPLLREAMGMSRT